MARDDAGGAGMKLAVSTPQGLAVSEEAVVSLRAEDASGTFGILARHADFVTVLSVSVLSWVREDGSRGYCAVRGGVLTVSGGERIDVATQEAVRGDELSQLELEVAGRLRAADEQAREARTDARRLHLAAVESLIRYARPASFAAGPGDRPPGGET
mgnify:CR=1 FL=1